MLGVTLAKDPNFPFTIEQIEKAITIMNEKFAKQNIEVLHKAIKDAKGA
jgi:indolepyruvate ferredoxin oxidoreductase beta subunit